LVPALPVFSWWMPWHFWLQSSSVGVLVCCRPTRSLTRRFRKRRSSRRGRWRAAQPRTRPTVTTKSSPLCTSAQHTGGCRDVVVYVLLGWWVGKLLRDARHGGRRIQQQQPWQAPTARLASCRHDHALQPAIATTQGHGAWRGGAGGGGGGRRRRGRWHRALEPAAQQRRCAQSLSIFLAIHRLLPDHLAARADLMLRHMPAVPICAQVCIRHPASCCTPACMVYVCLLNSSVPPPDLCLAHPPSLAQRGWTCCPTTLATSCCPSCCPSSSSGCMTQTGVRASRVRATGAGCCCNLCVERREQAQLHDGD